MSNLRRIPPSAILRSTHRGAGQTSGANFCRGNSSNLEIGGRARGCAVVTRTEACSGRTNGQEIDIDAVARSFQIRRRNERESRTGCPHRRTVSRAYDLIKFNMTRSLSAARQIARNRAETSTATISLVPPSVAPSCWRQPRCQRAISHRKCHAATRFAAFAAGNAGEYR